MFKVGDRVELLDNSGLSGNYVIGNVYTIKDFDSLDGMYSLGEGGWVYTKDIKLVAPYTWTSKFNIGDKVVTKKGEKGTIDEILFNKTNIEYGIDCDFYFEKNLSLYKEPTVKEMTVGEVEKELGYTIKIIKEEV